MYRSRNLGCVCMLMNVHMCVWVYHIPNHTSRTCSHRPPPQLRPSLTPPFPSAPVCPTPAIRGHPGDYPSIPFQLGDGRWGRGVKGLFCLHTSLDLCTVEITDTRQELWKLPHKSRHTIGNTDKITRPSTLLWNTDCHVCVTYQLLYYLTGTVNNNDIYPFVAYQECLCHVGHCDLLWYSA